MYKTLDNKGRWRNVIISFRMSPQERDDLNVRVKLLRTYKNRTT